MDEFYDYDDLLECFGEWDEPSEYETDSNYGSWNRFYY